MEPPAPSPGMVDASRRHLTERYASGVDLLLWETEKRLVPDLDAIKAVVSAAVSGQAEGLDMGAALVLVQAVRLGLDRLECDIFDAARVMGMRPEVIAAVLELPDAAAAEKRHRWLETRRALPYAVHGIGAGGPGVDGTEVDGTGDGDLGTPSA